jgi:hypothetical protein
MGVHASCGDQADREKLIADSFLFNYAKLRVFPGGAT